MATVARKPVPRSTAPPLAPTIVPIRPMQQAPSQPTQPSEKSHSRTRTNSSGVMPGSKTPSPQPPQPPSNMSPSQQSRRTFSSTTPSTMGSNGGLYQVPTNSTYGTTTGVRRSTSKSSNSSSASPTSYVALMRKQKATVWCDRAQLEDPRILAAQREAKSRAAAEVAGGHSYATSSARLSAGGSGGVVGGVRSKIRHHGAPKASAYSATHLIGVGVPMRLSASEVDEDDSDEEHQPHRYYQTRTTNRSSRSSLGSDGRQQHLVPGNNSSAQNLGLTNIYVNGSTPQSSQSLEEEDDDEDFPEDATPGPNDYRSRDDGYFFKPSGSGGSSNSAERGEESFGNISGLPHTRGKPTPQEQIEGPSADELRRRGSVDDRTMTMSGVRLFVANPDLSD